MMDFKVRCTRGYGEFTTTGNIYDVIGGNITFDNGLCSYGNFKNVKQMNSCLKSQFELVEENQMKYKVGDKVLIRSDLKHGGKYGKFEVTDSMSKMIGKTGTIKSVGYCGYTIDDQRFFTDEMIERKIDFTKDELKVGYVVEYRNGSKRMVIETDKGKFFASSSGTASLCLFDDQLNGGELSIMKVWGFSPDNTKWRRLNTESRPLLWERKEEPIEITIEEIAKLKGVSADRIRIKE